MEVKFAKYHGCGNDFIIIDDAPTLEYSKLAKALCNRVLGIGADGLIAVKKDPLTMIFYNADGSEGTMCGNGIRCFAKYCLDHGIISGNFYEIVTPAGLYRVENLGHDRFRVKMGKPDFSTVTLKMNTKLPVFWKQQLHGIEVTAVYTGTVHAVVYVSELESVLTGNLGALISNDPVFADRANVNFVQILDEKNFRVRTYERGVGWTFACGTGATASYAVGKLDGICHDSVSIHFPYGTLLIEEIEDTLYLSGEACHIASGHVRVPLS